MGLFRKAKRKPLRVQRAALKVPAARTRKLGAAAVSSRVPGRSRDLHRAAILVASLVALICGMLAGGYGVHAQMAAAQERHARYFSQVAAATRAQLREGAVLFVPMGGNVCRRRWIDNVTWTIRDGGEVECDGAVSWNSTLPEAQYQVGLRMDAVRNTFRAKAAGNLE